MSITRGNSTLPASDGFNVTASDVTVFDDPFPRAIYVGTGGNVVVVTIEDTTLTFNNFPSGEILPVRAKQVLAATTASNIIALR